MRTPFRVAFPATSLSTRGEGRARPVKETSCSCQILWPLGQLQPHITSIPRYRSGGAVDSGGASGGAKYDKSPANSAADHTVLGMDLHGYVKPLPKSGKPQRSLLPFQRNVDIDIQGSTSKSAPNKCNASLCRSLGRSWWSA